MSDMTTDQLRRTMKAIVGTAPEASDVLEHRLVPDRRRRHAGGVLVAAAAFVTVVLVGGLSVFLLIGGPNTDAAGGVSPAVNDDDLMADASGRVHLPGDFVVSVVGGLVESEGAVVYLGRLGPEPDFDTSQLGTQVSLNREPPANLVVPPKTNPADYLNALQSPLLVYLGDINGAQIALQWSRLDGQDGFGVFVGNGTAVTGGGIGKPFISAHPVSGNAADPPIGGWVVWTKLADDTSVVRMELADGSSYWQRPAGRTVFFNLPDQTRLDTARLTTFDASGRIIITEDAKSQIEIELQEDMRLAP